MPSPKLKKPKRKELTQEEMWKILEAKFWMADKRLGDIKTQKRLLQPTYVRRMTPEKLEALRNKLSEGAKIRRKLAVKRTREKLTERRLTNPKIYSKKNLPGKLIPYYDETRKALEYDANPNTLIKVLISERGLLKTEAIEVVFIALNNLIGSKVEKIRYKKQHEKE